MAVIRDVRLPDISDIAKARVIEILVAVGDRVQPQASMLTLESDKATLEIPAPFAGVVTAIVVKLGDTVITDSVLLQMAVDIDISVDSPAPPRAQPTSAATVLPNVAPIPQLLPVENGQTRPPVAARPSDYTSTKPHASPSVRRFARELGVDLGQIPGSGPKERILHSDVQGFVRQALTHKAAISPYTWQLPQIAEVDFSRFGSVTTSPLSRIRRLSAKHLHQCWLTVPHVTQFDAADITDLEQFRQSQNSVVNEQKPRLTVLPFILKACAAALKALPIFNSTLAHDGESLLVRQYIHIGVAIETPDGLLVPVIRNVDQQTISQLAQALQDLSAKARQGKLTPAELQGGCFSVSNLGSIGSGIFTPIINAPEAAIIGLSRAEMRPNWNGREFIPRLMLPMALSYDHRVIDGADGARFMVQVRQLLEDIRRLLL